MCQSTATWTVTAAKTPVLGSSGDVPPVAPPHPSRPVRGPRDLASHRPRAPAVHVHPAPRPNLEPHEGAGLARSGPEHRPAGVRVPAAEHLLGHHPDGVPARRAAGLR